MQYWIDAEGMGHNFFYAFPVSLLILFLILKGRRVRFLLPSLLITLVIVNPVFYKYWEKLGLYAYWRVLWVVPVVPIVAALVPAATEKVWNVTIYKPLIGKISRALIVTVCFVGIILSGSFVYNTARGQFEIAGVSSTKLPDYVVQIADKLLELDKQPRIIAQDPIGVYIRQYTGEIDSLFGRDAHGYITFGASKNAAIVQNELINLDSDLRITKQFMLDNDYDFLITNRNAGKDFELIDRVGDYGIYKATGVPSIIKKRNELGQVVSETTIDKTGKPENNGLGFASIIYSYDDNGFVNHKAWFTEINEPYMHSSGYFGLNEVHDSKGNLIARYYLNDKDIETDRADGFSKVEWITDGTDKVILLDEGGRQIDITGINLVKDADDNWSEWISPQYYTANSCIVTDTVVLGEKKEGDNYSCQFEIEFRNVSVAQGHEFLFQTQGAVDNGWNVNNVWGLFAVLHDSPPDGVYQYSMTCRLDEDMANASEFDIGFRCDNWSSGEFRIRKIKIEKNTQPSEWTQGL